jgi:hypothetical protein
MADVNIVYRIGADIAGLEKGVSRAATAAEGLAQTASRVGMALGAAFSVTAIKGAIDSTIEYASSINDMSARTNIGVVALQELEYSAKMVGLGLQDVTLAINQMQKRLGSGEAKKAIEAIGLTMKDLRAMKPEDQFFAIAQKVAAIKDPTAQVNTAMALFGRQGAAILPLITSNLDELRSAASAMSEETISKLDTLGDQLDTLQAKARTGFGGALIWLMGAAEKTFDVMVSGGARAVSTITGALATLFEKAGAVSAKVPGLSALSKTLTEQGLSLRAESKYWGEWADAAATAAVNVGRVDPAAKKAGASVKGLTDNFGANDKAAEKAAEALRKYNAALDAHIAKGGAFIAMQDRFNAAMVTNLSVTQQLPAGILEIAGASGQLHDSFGWIPITSGHFAQELMPAIEGNGEALRGMEEKAEKADDSIGDLARSLSQLAEVSGGTFGGMVSDLASVVAGIDAAVKSYDAFSTGMDKGGFKGLLGAASGILGMISAVVSIGKAIGRLFGIGKSQNLIDTEKATADLQAYGAEWVKTAGGIERARERANAFGFDLDGILNNKGKQGFENVKTDLGAIDEKWQTLQDAMDRYGISVDELGPKFKQLAQNDWADQISTDFAILTEAGMASDAALVKMKDDINAFIQRSIKMGTEVPLSMAPMLQQMIDLGLLTDENGDAITSLEDAGISFSKTMTQAFEGLNDTLDRLPERIAAALRGIPDSISIPVDVPVNIHGKNYGSADVVPEFATGSNGYQNFGSGTLAMLHGWEKVTPLGVGGGDGVAAQSIIVPVYLDGRQIAEATVPHIPAVVKRYGLR